MNQLILVIQIFKIKIKYLYTLMDTDIRYLVVNGDTNYVVALIVVVFSAFLLQNKSKSNSVNRRSKSIKIIENALFLASILVIANYNLTLAGILSILFISMNV